MNKFKFILFIALFSSLNAFAQIDREFWFAFPDITSGDYGADNSIKLCVISFENSATVHITQPAEIPGFDYRLDTTVVLPPNSVRTLDLVNYKGQLETNAELSYPSGMPFGVLITSDNNISCYYANTSNDSEIYTLKGRNALGIDFLVPMQFEYNCGAYADAFNSIEIVATENDTEIDIELLQWTTSSLQTTQTQTVHITLNRGWAYSFAARGKTGAAHLHNTRIKSNKPVAVSSTDDSVTPGDLVGDQLIPVKANSTQTLAGKKFVGVRNFGNIEKVYLFPTEKNTRVWVDNIEQTPFANLGEKMVIDLKTQMYEATYIESDKPVVCFQITAKQNSSELGGAIIPSIACTGSTETVYKSAFNGTIVLDLIVKTAYTSDFLVNGQSGIITASDFGLVQGNPDYSFARKVLSANDAIVSRYSGVIRISNPMGFFHAGALDYGKDNSCSYGYFSDFREIEIKAVTDQDSYVVGNDLTLTLQNGAAMKDIIWTKPDGTQVSANPLVLQNITAADGGTYKVTAASKDECIMPEAGFVVVNVFVPETKNVDVCENDSVKLTSRGEPAFTWYSEQKLPEVIRSITVSPTVDTVYRVENHQLAQNITINGHFQEGNRFFESDYLYGGSTATAVTSGGYYSVWKSAVQVNSALRNMYDHTTNSSSDGMMLIANIDGVANRKIWKKKLDVIPNTRYKLSAWFITPARTGTQANLDFVINEQVQNKSIIPPLFTQATSKKENWAQDSCFWYSGTRTSVEIAIITNEGNTAGTCVCIDDIEFSPYLAVTDTFHVKVIEYRQPVISGDTILCSGNATLDAGVEADAYAWFKENENTVLSTDRTFTASVAGNYIVEASNGICVAADTFTVSDVEKLEVALTDSLIQICPDETEFSLSYQIEEDAVYDLKFEDNALAAGFADIMNQPAAGGVIVVPLPSNVLAGNYSASLKFFSTVVCSESADIPLKITVKVGSTSLMAQKWNDVLALYNPSRNGGLVFTAYQWYKNGQALDGETGSYLYLGEGKVFDPADRYAVLLTLSDGSTIMTCDLTPASKELSKAVIQNPVRPAQQIKLGEIPVSGTATFYEITGLVYSVQQIQENYIVAPNKKGIYFLKIDDGITKIIVQ
ncbi:MAG: IgGFc-binding protein [Dysgonamonadaceae bacterium]|jgi:hypothetical protein|nr:IgGFc-binding protein [Dysgonamonadaceae bacterium]